MALTLEALQLQVKDIHARTLARIAAGGKVCKKCGQFMPNDVERETCIHCITRAFAAKKRAIAEYYRPQRRPLI